MQHFRQNKKLLLLTVGISIIIIEIFIFAMFFSISNNQPIIQIIDKNNNIINKSEARTFSVFKMYLFEKKYGSLDNFRVKIERNDIAFPFRAWFFAAFCMPILIVFIIAFILKLLRNSQKITSPLLILFVLR